MARLSAVGFVMAAGLALLAPLGAAQAQMKIAVVNVPRLLEEAPQAKGAMQALQDEFAPRQRDIVAQQQGLKTKEDRSTRVWRVSP
jgi:outer membrane protein